jgi:hypothetical protein
VLDRFGVEFWKHFADSSPQDVFPGDSLKLDQSVVHPDVSKFGVEHREADR